MWEHSLEQGQFLASCSMLNIVNEESDLLQLILTFTVSDQSCSQFDYEQSGLLDSMSTSAFYFMLHFFLFMFLALSFSFALLRINQNCSQKELHSKYSFDQNKRETLLSFYFLHSCNRFFLLYQQLLNLISSCLQQRWDDQPEVLYIDFLLASVGLNWLSSLWELSRVLKISSINLL